MEQDVSEEQQAYNGNSSAWYLASQKNISNALVTLSSAFWDNIYLENENTLSPYIVNPSNCKESSTIKQTVTQYLTEVKNVSFNIINNLILIYDFLLFFMSVASVSV